VLLGRLSLFGQGATRLHEEILTVAARWTDPAARRGRLAPYGRDAEARTLELMEAALAPNAARPPAPVAKRLAGSLARDVEELMPHLRSRGEAARDEAAAALAERGRIESESMRKILEDQRKRVMNEVAGTAQRSLELFDAAEKRQLESNRRYWQRWLENVDDDLRREPTRIHDFYQVASHRLEPIGVAYLWPVTG